MLGTLCARKFELNECFIAKSIYSIKQKVEKCDEIIYKITLFIIQWPIFFFCHLVVLILIIREICFESIQLGVNQVLGH